MKKKVLIPVLFVLSISLVGCSSLFPNSNGGDPETPEVKEVELTGIEVTTLPNKLVYTVGERFDNTGMVVSAKYSDNTTKEIVGYSIDKNRPLTLEDTNIVVTYKGMTTQFDITVKNAEGNDDFTEIKSSDVSQIFIEEDGFDIYWGETYTLRYSYAPSDANNPEFSLRSTN
ncbi:MAG: bacterial Ig-like domain-containing protein [Bacilli bacterium]|nr:bacterial Ig-like domain-containing protein [Bacilli bacterium]